MKRRGVSRISSWLFFYLVRHDILSIRKKAGKIVIDCSQLLEYTNYSETRKTKSGIRGKGSISRAAGQRAKRHGGKDGAGSIGAEKGSRREENG